MFKLIHISPLSFSGERTFSHDSMNMKNKMIMEKVLSDERTTAYAESINDINNLWLNCKECNWYKSEQTILSEERLSI